MILSFHFKADGAVEVHDLATFSRLSIAGHIKEIEDPDFGKLWGFFPASRALATDPKNRPVWISYDDPAKGPCHAQTRAQAEAGMRSMLEWWADALGILQEG